MSNDRQRIQYKRTATGALTQLRKEMSFRIWKAEPTMPFYRLPATRAIDGNWNTSGFGEITVPCKQDKELSLLSPIKTASWVK